MTVMPVSEPWTDAVLEQVAAGLRQSTPKDVAALALAARTAGRGADFTAALLRSTVDVQTPE